MRTSWVGWPSAFRGLARSPVSELCIAWTRASSLKLATEVLEAGAAVRARVTPPSVEVKRPKLDPKIELALRDADW